MDLLEERKKLLLPKIADAVDAFLREHEGLTYYCFAFDCNAEYAEINLCLNTESDFEQTWKIYQTEPYGATHQTEEDALYLRYNTGDWKYQCFETFYVLTGEEIAQLYGDEDEALLADMMELNYELLASFCKTDSFQRIPKSQGFRVLCVDHDADLLQALRDTAQRIQLD